MKAPFIDEISGLAIIKMIDGSTHSTMLLKLKFMCNAAILDIVNNGTKLSKAYCNKIYANTIDSKGQKHFVSISINL